MVENCTAESASIVAGEDNTRVAAALESEDESVSSVEGEDAYDNELTTDGVVVQELKEEAPSFGSVSVVNSTDIHFGNKTVYHGPVTIRQVVYATGKEESEFEPRQPLPEPRDDVVPVSKASCPDQDLESHHTLKLCLGKASGKRHLLVWLVTLSVSVILVIALTLLLVFVSRSEPEQAADDPTSKGHSGELTSYNQPRTRYDVTLSGKLRILGRKDWLAQPPTRRLDDLKLPVPYVIISHTATEACHSQAECVYLVRLTQTFHIESRGWSDIGYNYLVGGDGYVYTGRGWDKMGSHAYGYNICSIGISFIGTFTSEHPPAKQLLAATQLIEEGVKLGKISREYKLLGHRQVSATESPGEALFKDLQTLPNWLAEPITCAQVTRTQHASSTLNLT